MTPDDFVIELAGLADQPDTQSISNNDAVRQANILAASPKARGEGIVKLATLAAEHPMSGNICALYTQAMAWDGRIEDALAFAREKLPQVSKKSDLATVAGIVSLQTGRLRDATLWFLRAVAAQGKTASDEHLLLELSSIYRAVGQKLRASDLLAAASELERHVADRVHRSTENDTLRLAEQADHALVSIMSATARHFGWTKSDKKKWWQVWR